MSKQKEWVCPGKMMWQVLDWCPGWKLPNISRTTDTSGRTPQLEVITGLVPPNCWPPSGSEWSTNNGCMPSPLGRGQMSKDLSLYEEHWARHVPRHWSTRRKVFCATAKSNWGEWVERRTGQQRLRRGFNDIIGVKALQSSFNETNFGEMVKILESDLRWPNRQAN